MALGTCLTDLRERRLISEAAFERLRPVYDELVQQYEGRYGREAAEAMATEKALELAESDALQRKRKALLQAKKQGEWLGRMRQAAPEGGPLPVREAEDFMVEMDGARRAVRQQSLQLLYGLLERHRRDLVGRVRRPEELLDTLGELWGRDSGNLNAREIAQAWGEVAEWLRSRFNAAGGAIGKLEAWRLPQRHDMRSVRDAGFEGWRDFLVPLLDRAAMIDRATGEPISDGKLELLLRDMWQAVATDGWSRNTPGGIFEGAMANRHADHRMLHFAGPEEWTAYADRFGGGGTAFDAMLAHVESMSRDIAAMEAMGPNPTATLRFMQDWIEKSTEEALLTGRAGKKASDRASSGRESLQGLWDTYTGAANRPVKRRLALGFSIFRSQQVAAKLGGAMLSAGGDYGMMAHTARFNGLPAAKVMGRYMAMLNPANTADRAQAARHVLMADQWADSHAAQWRTTGEEIAHEGASRLATGVIRASGLSAHTDIARQAFAMETVAHWTHMRERSFARLDPPFQRMLQRYGISEGRWDKLRSIAPVQDRGTDWLYPETVAAAGDQALADDLMRLLVTEGDYAVPVPDLRTRAMIATSFRKGTWIGEIAASGFLFKGFPLTVLNMHGRRMLEQATLAEGAQMAGVLMLRYGLGLMALTTLGGGLSLQLKEVARGRDPLPMDDAKFWGAALAQGGGLGIIGDFLYSLSNRFGQGMAQTLMGPMAQAVDNSAGMVASNLKAQFDSDPETETKWKKDFARLALSETPGLSLWYARLAIERSLGDMVQEWAHGDDVAAHYRRLDQNAAERGTAYYAPPGLGVQRAPNLGNMIGGGGPEDVPLVLPH